MAWVQHKAFKLQQAASVASHLQQGLYPGEQNSQFTISAIYTAHKYKSFLKNRVSTGYPAEILSET